MRTRTAKAPAETGDPRMTDKKEDLECCYWKSGNYCLKLKSRVGFQDCSKGCEFWKRRN